MEYDYRNILVEIIKDYKGEHKEIILVFPSLYDLVILVLEDHELDRELRLRLFSALGYLVLPNDLYSEEEHGAIGFVDDIMLLLHVLRDINEKYSDEYLENLWRGEGELSLLLSEGFESLTNNFSDLYAELMEYMGF